MTKRKKYSSFFNFLTNDVDEELRLFFDSCSREEQNRRILVEELSTTDAEKLPHIESKIKKKIELAENYRQALASLCQIRKEIVIEIILEKVKFCANLKGRYIKYIDNDSDLGESKEIEKILKEKYFFKVLRTYNYNFGSANNHTWEINW